VLKGRCQEISFDMKELILSVFIFTFGCTATHALQVNTLLAKQLPEAPGKEIEVITVNYPPGAVDAIHRHDAHAVVYVLDGKLRSTFDEARVAGLAPGRYFTSHLKTCIPYAVTRVRRNQRSSSYFLSKMKEHRTWRHHEFKSRATQREWDRDC